MTSGPKVYLNCLNSLTTLILCSPPSNLNLLIQIVVTDIYSKPTESHLYLPFSSTQPSHCKRAIPYGVAQRIKVSIKENQVPVKKILVARVFSLQRQVIYQIKAKRSNDLIKDFISSNFKRRLSFSL